MHIHKKTEKGKKANVLSVNIQTNEMKMEWSGNEMKVRNRIGRQKNKKRKSKRKRNMQKNIEK